MDSRKQGPKKKLQKGTNSFVSLSFLSASWIPATLCYKPFQEPSLYTMFCSPLGIVTPVKSSTSIRRYWTSHRGIASNVFSIVSNYLELSKEPTKHVCCLRSCCLLVFFFLYCSCCLRTLDPFAWKPNAIPPPVTPSGIYMHAFLPPLNVRFAGALTRVDATKITPWTSIESSQKVTCRHGNEYTVQSLVVRSALRRPTLG